MANTTVTTDRLEALEVTGDFAAEVALDHPLVLGDAVKDLIELLLIEIIGPHVRIEASFGDDQIGPLRTDTVDVAKSVGELLLCRNINTK